MADGVERPVAGIDGPRVCLTAGLADCAIGRGVVLFAFIDRRDFGILGVTKGFGAGAEVSDIGGEGGVGASEIPEETDFVGGV